MLRCPRCLGLFEPKSVPDSWFVCIQCRRAYPSKGTYYDFHVPEADHSSLPYPPELAHLYYDRERILSLSHPASRGILDRFKSRQVFNNSWEESLNKLQETTRQYGTSEKDRIADQATDYSSEQYALQADFVRRKSGLIMFYVSRVRPTGTRVLHVGCGGRTHRAIPVEYAKAGFVNYGVDVSGPYVEEFLEYGEAHLADALYLPYADETFDIVNFSDILEHLFDPLRGLREAGRVLKRGSHLVLDTPNRAHIGTKKNPLSFVRYYAEQLFPGLMRERTITDTWEGRTYFHTEFSRKEIEALLCHAGFEPMRLKSESLRDKIAPSVSLEYCRQAGVKFLETLAPTGPWFAIAEKKRHISRGEMSKIDDRMCVASQADQTGRIESARLGPFVSTQ
jgi:SAM-dependent methyltransferase